MHRAGARGCIDRLGQASALAAAELAGELQGLGKMGKMEKWWQNEGKWGGIRGNREKWAEMGNCEKLPKWEMWKKCVKLVGNGRKIVEKCDNFRQIPHFPQPTLFSFFHSLATFPPRLQAELADWKNGEFLTS